MKPANPLVEKYGEQKRWVTWKLETRNGKQTKVPYSHTGKLASSTDAKTWTHYEAARTASPNIGIVFTPEQNLLGIDIDHCLVDGNVVHEQQSAINALLAASDTYTEISPSGEGLHLYFDLSEPMPLTANRHAPFEVYTSGRYFTVTGTSYHTIGLPVRTISPAEAVELLKLIGYPWSKDPFDSSNEVTEQATPARTTYLETIPDEELLERMFNASNGADIYALYHAQASARVKYAKDASKADMGLLAHLAFWTNKNAQQMERLWLASPLGNREKTTGRSDYRVRSIKVAIANCAQGFVPWEQTEEAQELDLLSIGKGKNKKYPLNTENICRILRNHVGFKGAFRFDEYRAIAERKENGVWRAVKDSDAIDLQTRISILFPQFTMVSKNMCWDALIKVTEENIYDSGADYLKALVWDTNPRLDTWLTNTYHAPLDPLHASIGANWLKGMVKRVIEPGCKFDYVLVLEGPQGVRKSSSLGILAGALGHVETTMSTDTKDFFMQFLGNSIVEFSEGETLSRTETKKLKAIITVQNDKFRPPYGRTVIENPRRCVFAMTTNQSEYLKDETGNRRWLPVAVEGLADTDWLLANREQLLAEAYHRVITLKETTYEFPVDAIATAQQQRRVRDPNEERIMLWYLNILSKTQREEGITVTQVYQEALNGGFMGKPITRGEEMSIADVMKTGLMLERKRVMVSYVQSWRWYPSDKTLAMLPTIVLPQNLEF